MSSGEKEEKRISRRDFVRGAAVGAAGVAAASVLAGCANEATPEVIKETVEVPVEVVKEVEVIKEVDSKPWLPEKWDEEADVVVAGFGAAGSAAAIDAHDSGAEVIILEKMPFEGGSIRRCGGAILGAGTVVQAALGVEDSPDKLYEWLMLCWANSNIDPARIRIIADNAGKNVDWVVEDLGADMPWELGPPGINPGLNSTCGLFPNPPGHDTVEPERSHWMYPEPGYEDEGWEGGMVGGTGLFLPFWNAIKARGIRVLLETPLVELVVTPDGEVLGVKAESGGKTLYVKAKKAVFLGTGGWRNNVKMLKNYHPGASDATISSIEASLQADGEVLKAEDVAGTFLTEPNPQLYSLHADGSGVIAGMAIGADLVNMQQLDTTNFECAGGLRINNEAQVIDVFGNVIPRLYAAGCVTGGTIGQYYAGCGGYVAFAVCFGRIGGKNAAAEKAWS